jgi:hypothetical protein
MKHATRLLFAFVLLAALACAPVVSEEITPHTDFNFVFATTLETKAKLIESVQVPALRGDGLFASNGFDLKAGAELSPVSVNGTLDVAFTPIAFLVFYGGASAGTGWNIPIATGLAHVSSIGTTGPLTLANADGMVWSAKAGGTFQFDLAAVLPGDWNHVVLQTSHEAKYRALTSAAAGESWLYEADLGENQNGWSYYGNLFLGYQTPTILDTAGLLFEGEKYLYGTTGGAAWGDDLMRYTAGFLFNFKLNKDLSIALILQTHTVRHYTDGSKDYDTDFDTYYRNRVLAATNPVTLELYRAALNLTWRLM